MTTRIIQPGKLAICGCLAFAGAALIPGATLGPGNGAAAETSPPRLVPCAGVPAALRVRCGSIRVPLDRANLKRGTTGIAFALARRNETARPALATIVVSGPDVLRAVVPYAQGLAPLRDRRDLLFVDFRGASQSGALACRALRGTELAFVSSA